MSKILIVEDNQVNQIVLRHLLKNNGFECDIVSTGDFEDVLTRSLKQKSQL